LSGISRMEVFSVLGNIPAIVPKDEDQRIVIGDKGFHKVNSHDFG
jgi:hypothetical protein